MKRTTNLELLTGILRGRPVVVPSSDLIGLEGCIKTYSGIALKDFASLICEIKKGQKIDGMKYDDGAWFIMPAHNPKDKNPEGFRDCDWRCCAGVPGDHVQMKERKAKS